MKYGRSVRHSKVGRAKTKTLDRVRAHKIFLKNSIHWIMNCISNELREIGVILVTGLVLQAEICECNPADAVTTEDF